MKREGNEVEIMDIMSPSGLNVGDLNPRKRALMQQTCGEELPHR